MHQSFVTTAPMGPGNSGDFDFSLYRTQVYATTAGTFFVQSPVKSSAKILASKREITLVVLGMESVLWNCRDIAEVKTW